jgi:hypothetical protein
MDKETLYKRLNEAVEREEISEKEARRIWAEASRDDDEEDRR